MDDVRWGKALLNGLFVWLISLIIHMIPAFVFAFWRGAQLGSQSQDYGALSQQISQEISAMYAESWALIAALVVITAVLILWRARAVANGTWHMRWLNGLIVGAVPAVLSLSFVLCGGLGLMDAVTIAVYLVTGLVGGLSARPT